MIVFRKSVFAGLVVCLGLVGHGYAEGVAVGGRVGTTGLGGDVTVRLTDYFNARVSGTWLKMDTDGSVDDVDFTWGLDYTMYGALLDIHPFANGFRISGGAYFGSNNTTLDAKLSEEQKIGDHTYTPEQIGTLKGKVKFEREPAPYIGIGYDNAVSKKHSFSFVFDFGFIFQTYEVEMTADGTAAQSRQFQNDLNDLESSVQSDLDDFNIYPVISFGLAYQF